MQYHVDGELIPHEEATISVRDRGFRFGDAAIERLRVYGGTIFNWSDHSDRLVRTCDQLGIDYPEVAGLHRRVTETLTANELEEATVRISVTRGIESTSDASDAADIPSVVITVTPRNRSGRHGSPPWEGPATMQTVRTRRIPPSCLPGSGVTHNQLTRVLARQELEEMAVDEPADEAVLRDTEGNVTGGATTAVFFVDDDGLYTPAVEGLDDASIIRETILELAAEEDIPTAESTVERDELHTASELFIANTTIEIRPVETIDGVAAGGGPVTELLASRYAGLIETTCY